MTMAADFREKMIELAGRAVATAPRCANEESTKLFLVVPFISFLGYDPLNPNEVFPEHGADFSEKYKNRVDFAILKGETPIIAIECKTVGAALRDDRGQLRSYFNAAKSVKMGILTDGLMWEFFADSDEPNLMDENPFLSVDLREVAKGKLDESAVEGLKALHKTAFDPENIGAEAKRKHIFNSVLRNIGQLSQDPSEAFCRMLLQQAGITHARQKTIDEYRSVIQRAFREFINQQILQRLDLQNRDTEKPDSIERLLSVKEDSQAGSGSKISTSDLELSVFKWVQHRLAFLVDDDELFSEIQNVKFRDYQGKFVIYYKMERKGRLFDFIERKNPDGIGQYHFVLPEDLNLGVRERSTDTLADLDNDLIKIFRARVTAIGKAAPPSRSQPQ